MGRHDHILHAPQRAVIPKRLGGEHVETGSGQAPVGQPLDEGLLVDRRPPAHVVEVGARLHGRDHVPADQASGGRPSGQRPHHMVGAGHRFAQALGPEHLRRVGAGPRRMPAHTDHAHTERRAPRGDGRSQGPQPDDAHRRARQPAVAVQVLPAALGHGLEVLGQAAGQRQHHGHAMLGHPLGVGTPGIAHHQPLAGGQLRGQVLLVARAGQQQQPQRARGQQVGVGPADHDIGRGHRPPVLSGGGVLAEPFTDRPTPGGIAQVSDVVVAEGVYGDQQPQRPSEITTRLHGASSEAVARAARERSEQERATQRCTTRRSQLACARPPRR